MKQILIGLIFSSFFVVACNSDDCVQADWIGNYALDSGECGLPGGFLLDNLTITEGSEETALIINGKNVIFNGCTLNLTSFRLTLEGNEIKLRDDNNACSGIYIIK